MLTIQPLRWGKPYNSLDTFDVIHFDTGEAIAKIGQVTGGMVQLDMRKADQARKALRKLSKNAKKPRSFSSMNHSRLVMESRA
jgi:hypothetical protein